MGCELPSIDVSAAVLVKGNRVLIAQRPAGDPLEGKWEFPGGKVNSGECPRACLKRELVEELNIHARVGSFLGTSSYGYGDRKVTLLVFVAKIQTGRLTPLFHSEFRWISVDELLDHDLAPADIPVAKRLISGRWPLPDPDDDILS
ncbi:MAG: (deoxy)nucleoside triphosphate pyrophosphohydrolase [Desulfobacterales bacterium]|jgi:8-oxo-dGTP diphosphatase